MKCIFFVCVFFLLLSTFVMAGPNSRTQITINTQNTVRIDDTYISEENPANNYADATVFDVRETANYSIRGLFYFSMKVLQDLGITNVTKAELHLYATRALSTEAYIYKLNPPSWSETWPTWTNSNASYDPASKVTTTFTPANPYNQWIKWNITTILNGWLTTPTTNMGLMLINAPGGEILSVFSSEYADVALRPMIVVESNQAPGIALQIGALPKTGNLSEYRIKLPFGATPQDIRVSVDWDDASGALLRLKRVWPAARGQKEIEIRALNNINVVYKNNSGSLDLVLLHQAALGGNPGSQGHARDIIVRIYCASLPASITLTPWIGDPGIGGLPFVNRLSLFTAPTHFSSEYPTGADVTEEILTGSPWEWIMNDNTASLLTYPAEIKVDWQ